MATATMTSKGQVTIPKEVRDALRLRPGVKVTFTVQPDGTAILRPRTVSLLDLVGILKADRHATIEEMNEVIAKGWAGELEP